MGVGLGLRVGLGFGVGVGFGPDEATVNRSVADSNFPEPHVVLEAFPGLSATSPVQVAEPWPRGVTVIRNTASSPTGSPTSGFESAGFLKETRVPP